jgi:hypothetical protein
MITYKQVWDVLMSLPDDKRNPVVLKHYDDGYDDGDAYDDYACVYTASDGRHCIAGQVLSTLGLPLPSVDDQSNSTVNAGTLVNDMDPRLFASDDDRYVIGRLLNQAQRTADTGEGEDPQVRMTWGAAKRTAREAYDENGPLSINESPEPF